MRWGKSIPEAPSLLRHPSLREREVWASLVPGLVSLRLVFRKVCVSSSADHLASSFNTFLPPREAPLMPHVDEIVARVPLVNFYALGALRKPNVLGGTPGPSAII